MCARKMSRREALKGLGLAAAGMAAAACQPKTVIVKETVKETVIVEGTAKVVEKIVEKVTTATPVSAEDLPIIYWSMFGLEEGEQANMQVERFPGDIMGPDYHEVRIVKEPLEIDGPSITLSDRPGLGVDVDWELVEQYRM